MVLIRQASIAGKKKTGQRAHSFLSPARQTVFQQEKRSTRSRG